MSLSSDPVFEELRTKFVCGWRNIEKESFAGKSGDHSPSNPAAFTTNGAGPHNTQLFVLAKDGTVLHCLPGYWDPRDLSRELAFAAELGRVWADALLSRADKDEKWRALHLGHLKDHPQEMVDRSVMQGFDKKFEKKKRPDTSDCILREGSLQPAHRPGGKRGRDEFKTTDQIMHERLATRPFVAYAKFDTAAFCEYGRPKYDKEKLDKK